MKIRNRLTLISSLVLGITFTLAIPFLYLIFTNSTDKIIYNKLENTCWIAGIFYLEEDELSKPEHEKVEAQFLNVITDAEVRIYDSMNLIAFGTKIPDLNIDADILDKVREQKKYHFKRGLDYYFGIFYPDNQGDFVVIIKETNQLVAGQRENLLLILLSAFLVGLLLIIVLSRTLANIAYKPLSDVIKQVNQIQPHSLHDRLKPTGTNDEIQALVDTFNKLLSRLSDAFGFQRNFINYVSHEFKTPLAAIAGNLEILTSKSRDEKEYKITAEEIIQDVYRLEKILNTLQTLSGIQKNNSEKAIIRLDELLWSAMDKITLSHPYVKFNVKMGISPDKEKLMNIIANEVQLEMAVYNLLENAVKYGNLKPINIELIETDNKPVLIITDYGIGIDTADLSCITQPFFRGQNTSETEGKGLGLSVSAQLLEINNIKLSISSTIGEGTAVILRFMDLA
jgi:two-component system, OmpR family, sensor histidine kinase ArlS